MTRVWLVLIVVLVSRVPVGADVARQCAPTADGVAEIRAVASGIIAADNARVLERVLQYYAADAIWMPPGQAAVVGRAAIRGRYEELFASFTPQIVPTIEEACVAGDLGFVRGHNGGQVVDRKSGAARALDDAYLMLLRRGPDGAWRISHLMWHRRSPVPPATAH